MSDSNLNNMCHPTALFELSISGDTSKENATNVDKLCLEFSHDELYVFFNQLEKIQSQIDQLSAK